jgi:Acetylornithine deacetylase/Succinyl-diaminopimelate desuccinylase and related deacylases
MVNKKHFAQIALLAAVLAVGAAGAAESDLVRLEKLIRIPSVSSNIVEVNRAVDFLDGELGRDGLYRQIETMPDGRRVLFAANESTKRPDILLSAHLDVVPEKDPSQFVPRRENGRIYGRGASDCKEHVVLCARLMRELKGRVSIGAIFGSDEEIGGMSTAFMLDKGYGAAKMVIVLDSEQFAITTRQKGLARYVIEADAPPTHAGMVKGAPPNAVRELILSYEAAAAEIPDFEDGTWRDVMMLERVSGTREHAEMEISVRCARKGGFESIENLLRNKFKRDLRCLRKGEAVLLDETQPYLVAFRERMRRAWPDRKVDFYHLNSSTDARHLQRLNLPMLILGVDARGAHTATEYVEIPSLDEYAVLIESYLMDEFGN